MPVVAPDGHAKTGVAGPDDRRPDPPGAAAEPAPRRGNPDAVVDCAVYADGVRQPGPRRLRRGGPAGPRDRRDAFVWLGLHEPDLADDAPRSPRCSACTSWPSSRPSTAGTARSCETIGEVTRLVLRTARYVEHAELTETSEVVETGDVTCLSARGSSSPCGTARRRAAARCAQDLEKRPDAAAPGAVVGGVRGLRPDGRRLPGGRRPRRAGPGTARGGRRSPATLAPSIAHIYQLKRELVEFKRAVLPLQEPLRRCSTHGRAAGRSCAATSSTSTAGWPGRWSGWPASTTCSTRSCRPGWPR